MAPIRQESDEVPGTAGDAPAVLVVDDEEPIRRAVGKSLAQLGYRVLLAGTAQEALEILRHQRVAVVILDLHLPGTSGMLLLPEVLELDPNLAILILTGDHDARNVATAMRGGAFDYLTKPVVLEELGNTVGRALQHRADQIERIEMRRWLQEEVADRRAAVQEEHRRIEQLATTALGLLVATLEAKDRFMAGHSVRVAQLSASIAAELGHSDDEIELVRTAGRLHDLGMIVVPDRILSKSEPLTDAEIADVRRHPIAGFELLNPLPDLAAVAAIVRSHHECWDGEGYPDGLSAEAIPWGGRIVAAAEIYDALVTDRVYRSRRMTPDEACSRMDLLAGQALDPRVQRALTAVVQRRRALEFLPDNNAVGNPAPSSSPDR
jgi:cyclic di-GMP phosphodiesterase